MQRTYLLMASILAVLAMLTVGCSGIAAGPAPTNQPTLPAANNPTAPAAASSNSSEPFESQAVEGGSVSVAVKPVDLKPGAPADFEIAMNTHSVNLSSDMLKVVVLRDNTGKEYAPTKWDGPNGGGHHRSGKLEFPALASNVKSVTLIVKDIAGVPERKFNWDLP